MAHAKKSRRTPLPEIGLPGDAALELPPPAANQVVADVRAARVGRAHVHLPRALDALQREQQLPFAGRHGQLLDGVAIPVAAAEVHPAVDAGRIALQHLLDEADALEELAPVERRDQAQAADQVGHAGLFGRLMLSLRSDRVLDRLSARRQRRFELLVQPRRERAERARALQQARDERVMDVRRPLVGRRLGPASSVAASRSAASAMDASRREHVASRAQMVEQRELQRARPRPQLAHRQRRDRLEGADEPLQPLRVEPARARSDQLERQRVDARQPGELVGGDARKPLEERRREIVMDVARRGRDDVEVVEQPFGGRRHRLLARVFGERRVDAAQRAHVAFELPQVRAAAAAGRGAIESSAARRRACSSSSSMLSSSSPPSGDLKLASATTASAESCFQRISLTDARAQTCLLGGRTVRAMNSRRHGRAMSRAHRLARFTRALSVAMPVFAYICR